jgi:hypothetical protein
MDPDSLVDLDAAITELRGLRSTGAVLGLLDVDDEFFVLLRPIPGGVALMVSDAAAALDYDVAADVLDLLRVDLPRTTTRWTTSGPRGPQHPRRPRPARGRAGGARVAGRLLPGRAAGRHRHRCGFADALAEVVDDP